MEPGHGQPGGDKRMTGLDRDGLNAIPGDFFRKLGTNVPLKFSFKCCDCFFLTLSFFCIDFQILCIRLRVQLRGFGQVRGCRLVGQPDYNCGWFTGTWSGTSGLGLVRLRTRSDQLRSDYIFTGGRGGELQLLSTSHTGKKNPNANWDFFFQNCFKGISIAL